MIRKYVVLTLNQNKKNVIYYFFYKTFIIKIYKTYRCTIS